MPTRQTISHSRSTLAIVISVSLISVLLFAALVTVLLIKHGNGKKARPSVVASGVVVESLPPAVSELEGGIVRSGEQVALVSGPDSAAPPRPASEGGGGGSGNARQEDAGPVELTGRNFSGESYNPPHLESEGMQLLQHYGETSATVTLTRNYSQVTLKLKPRAADGSFPLAKLFLDGVTKPGKHVRVSIMDNDTIQNEQPIVKKVSVEPGTYTATFQFLKSSKEGRAHLELHSVIFE